MRKRLVFVALVVTLSAESLSAFGHSCDHLLLRVRAQLESPEQLEKILAIPEALQSRAGAQWHVMGAHEAPLEELYAALVNSYKDLGLQYPNPDALRAVPYFFVARALQNGAVLAWIALFETPYGLKAALSSQDGSFLGKMLLSDLLEKIKITRGAFAEISWGMAKGVMKGARPRFVPFTEAQRILEGKVIERLTDEDFLDAVRRGELPNDPDVRRCAYKRVITVDGQPKTILKFMIGTPVFPE